MERQTAQQLMAGFSAFTTPDEVAASSTDGEAATITITVTSSQACISAASAVSAVSIDNTFDHGC
jgi:hypothetical protein